jgi:hypothetical protein
MSEKSIRRGRAVAVLLAAVLIAGACAGAAGTTSPSTATSSSSVVGASSTPTVGPTASPSESTLPATTTPLATAVATPTHSPTHSPTHKPTPAPTSRATGCTGTTKDKAVFADAAAKANFDVYCAVLPSGWSLPGASYYKRPVGSELDAVYHGPAGAVIQFIQGANCTTSVAACSTGMAILGPIAFGHVTGQLDLYDATPAYVVYVDPGTTHGHLMLGYGMTQTAFIAFSAAMKKVPKV